MAKSDSQFSGRRNILKGLVLLGPACQLSLHASPPSAAKDSQDLVLSASGLQITIDGRTGAWKRCVDLQSGHTLLESPPNYPIALLTVGGKESHFPYSLRPLGDPGYSETQSVGAAFTLTSHAFADEGEAALLAVECREKDWLLTVEYRIRRDLRRVERRFRFRYEGPGEQIIRKVDVNLPTIVAWSGFTLEVPDSDFAPSLPFESTQGRKLTAFRSGPRMVAVRDTSGKGALIYSAYSETEPPTLAGTGEPNGLRPSYSIALSARIKAGVEVGWGSDYLWVLEGEWPEVMKQFQKYWDEVGVRTPADRPKWTERPLLYETQIGAAPFDYGTHQFNPYPTMQSLLDKLDYIQGLGFNTFQIMPHHPYPSYASNEYYDSARQYGEGLKTLIQEAHNRKMRVIVDWVVHGVFDKELVRKIGALFDPKADEKHRPYGPFAEWQHTFVPYYLELAPEVHPLRLQYPDWFVRTESGELAFGPSWSFDLENRDLQDYIIEAMKSYVRDYDVDGFRVDAPNWNAFPNWDKKIPYRGSLSATGGIRLCDRALLALRPLKSELMMYSEPTDATYRRMFDVNYAYDEMPVMEGLLSWHRKVAPDFDLHPMRKSLPSDQVEAASSVTAYQFRAWLENRRMSMPRGSVTIHQADSHDSFWWLPWGYKFRRQQFGVEGYRALLFMLATIDGGLMQYPTGEEGSEDFMRRVFALRQNVREVSEGHCHYLKVKVSDDAVFAASWEGTSGWAVPLTNFGPSPLNARVSLPQAKFNWDPKTQYVARDIFNNKTVNDEAEAVLSGQDLENITLRLESLESALLLIRKLGEKV